MFLKAILRLAKRKGAPITRGFLGYGYVPVLDHRTNVLVGLTNAWEFDPGSEIRVSQLSLETREYIG